MLTAQVLPTAAATAKFNLANTDNAARALTVFNLTLLAAVDLGLARGREGGLYTIEPIHLALILFSAAS